MPKTPTFLHYALLAGAAFLASLALIGLLLWRAEVLVRWGLEGRLFYLALIPLGLAVAAFLFGCLKSYAVYKGKALGGVLELGGPVVAFFLMLILGFQLPEPLGSFDVTVYVQRQDEPSQPPTQGKLVLELGGDPREAALTDKGAAYFNGIPANFRGQTVAVRLLDVPGLEPAQDHLTLQAGGVRLAVRSLPAVFTGYVHTEDGQPVAGARISLVGHGATSDAAGYFRLALPRAEAESGASLHIQAAAFTPWDGMVVADGGEIQVVLRRVPMERP